MEKIIVFFIILQAFEAISCMVLGVVLYFRGIRKGILLCEMINSGGASATEFFGKSGAVAEHSLIEDDSEERKEQQDEDEDKN